LRDWSGCSHVRGSQCSSGSSPGGGRCRRS
jgi:hypothetical protein